MEGWRTFPLADRQVMRYRKRAASMRSLTGCIEWGCLACNAYQHIGLPLRRILHRIAHPMLICRWCDSLFFYKNVLVFFRMNILDKVILLLNMNTLICIAAVILFIMKCFILLCFVRNILSSINVMINLVQWRIQNQSILRRDYAMKRVGVQYMISSYLWVSHPWKDRSGKSRL